MVSPKVAVEHLTGRKSAPQNEELTLTAARVKEIFTSAEHEFLRYQRTGTSAHARQMRDTIQMSFASIGSDLLQTVRAAEPMLHQVGNADATSRPAPNKWSKKEILAHLIDSASNNHQRFVRAATQGNLEFPGYDQEKLVVLQNANGASWELVIELWSAYNRYLAHVLQQLPESSAQIQCSIGGRPPVTLVWLAGDYVEHLKHHLNQILGNKFQTGWTLSASM